MFLYKSQLPHEDIDGGLALSYKRDVAMPQGPFYRALGERVRRARQSAKFSQGRLADSVGLSRSSVANIETGRQPIYIHALVRIARQLETPVSKLIPPSGKELDSFETEELKRLPEDGRRFLNLILRKSTPDEKEHDAPAIFPGEETSGRSAKTRTRPKGSHTR
jgi:transcriptional regulator with XRE-family HTH domain